MEKKSKYQYSSKNKDKNSGGRLNTGILFFFHFLQQLEYVISLHFLLSVLFFSLNQNTALQYLQLYVGKPR